jgi:hypothetical protein
VRVIYLREGAVGEAHAPRLRCGAAGCAWLTEDGSMASETRVQLSANSTHALLGHGVVDALNELAIQGKLGRGLEVIIPSEVLDLARSIFYEADGKTYGASHEFSLGHGVGAGRVEYRIRIDNREYQRTLSALQFLLSSASREGRLVWLRI